MAPEEIKLESMKIAAKLLCCANQGTGNGTGDGGVFPGKMPKMEGDDLIGDWNDFLKAFLAMSRAIAHDVMSAPV